MTPESVPNSTSVLQVPSSPPPRFGRRAYGRQRRMSPETVARNIAESILKHRQRGVDRPISFYTNRPDTQALVQAKLDAMALATDAAMDEEVAPPPDRLGRP
jgi:hypothetical protein